MDAIAALAVASGLSFASGLRLYAVLFAAGAGHALGWIELPAALQVLADPLVLTVSGVLLAAEFLADKIPGLDSAWDAVHTFIRIPAGALLAVGALGPADAPAAVAAALLGATLAGSSHFTKAGSRLLINTSPEPMSNWSASLGEDALVPAILVTAFAYPLLFFALLTACLVLALWLLPRIARGLARFVRHIARMFGAPTR